MFFKTWIEYDRASFPQRLKPRLLCRFYGTTESRALPGSFLFLSFALRDAPFASPVATGWGGGETGAATASKMLALRIS
jgi:hypothetical protein